VRSYLLNEQRAVYPETIVRDQKIYACIFTETIQDMSEGTFKLDIPQE
jgi:hypothetical protein